MDPAERQAWIAAERVFGELLQLPAADRAAHLADLALPEDLHARVQRMLSAHAASTGPLDAPPDLSAVTETGGLSGRQLGRWRLVEELGRGGMAVVYRAESVSGPAGQQAAVKVLTVATLARLGERQFLREQNALLRLRHPYIAPLFDAGIEADGTPWLAMALVEGERIDEWCDTRRLDLDDRLRLVMQLGEALAYAHRSLVIHRDIKPSNVLVDADGHPRLLDFGIAGHADQAEATRTATLARALTPEYAAPEQFAGAPPSTALDVYGLGALCYRLLTGRPPRSQGDDETTETLTPSRAAQKHPEQKQQARHLRGDLDAILLKALARQPEERYATVEALCDDLRRWLMRRPVRARPPRRSYLLGRFIARHRYGVAATALIVVIATAGVAATLWQAREAQRQAEHALVTRDFLVGLFEASDPDIAQGRELTARELLDQGAHQVRTAFARSPTLRAEMLVLLGNLYRMLGEHDPARPLIEEGLELAEAGAMDEVRVDALVALGALEWALGRGDEALQALDRAERLLVRAGRTPGEQHATVVASLVPILRTGRSREAVERAEAALDMARTDTRLPPEALFTYLVSPAYAWVNVEEPKRALPYLREAVALDFEGTAPPTARLQAHAALFAVLERVGDLEGAMEHAQQARVLTEQIYPPIHPRRAEALGTLAMGLTTLGRYSEAEALMREALETVEAYADGDHHPQIAAHHHNLGSLLRKMERFADARPHLVQARNLARELFGREDVRYTLSTASLGNVMISLEQYEEAEQLLFEALQLFRELLGADHFMVGLAKSSLAALRLEEDRADEALAFAEAALALYRRADWEAAIDLIDAQRERARALVRLGRVEEAEASFAEAIALAETAGPDAGEFLPPVLAAWAEFLVERADPEAPAATARALQAHRDTFGDEHPATQRMEALAQQASR